MIRPGQSVTFTKIADRLAGAIVDRGLACDTDWSPDLPDEKLQRELDHSLQLRDQETYDPHVWLWTNPQCLVATRRHARHPQFDPTAATSAENGWPIIVRRSGGTVVPHGAGILNLSLFHQTETARIEEGYAPLMALLTGILSEALDIPAHYGSCEGTICDGAYNLLIDGRKVAGTAAMMKRQDMTGRWLAHATIMVDVDMEAAVGAVDDFERGLGSDPSYILAAHTNLADHWTE